VLARGAIFIGFAVFIAVDRAITAGRRNTKTFLRTTQAGTTIRIGFAFFIPLKDAIAAFDRLTLTSFTRLTAGAVRINFACLDPLLYSIATDRSRGEKFKINRQI